MKIELFLPQRQANATTQPHQGAANRLRPGDVVEVRSEDEIRATLDATGTADALPFMPEMRRFCGQRYQVLKRVSQVCTTTGEMRRMENTVILAGLTCDGSAHGGCQNTCLLFWKEAWLKRVALPATAAEGDAPVAMQRPDGLADIFSCQATELRAASTRIPAWDVRQYIPDLRHGTVRLADAVPALLTGFYNRGRAALGLKKHVRVHGRARPTPRADLNLQPGEWVRVKSREEIRQTLDADGRNRGLTFIPEMLKFCGREYRVLKRVDRMILETNGKMQQIASTVILEGGFCAGEKQIKCHRSMYHLWREIWLERIERAHGADA